jgi:hypothetical protein
VDLSSDRLLMMIVVNLPFLSATDAGKSCCVIRHGYGCWKFIISKYRSSMLC